MLAKWIKLRIKPELRHEFLAAIEVDALGSEGDEPGCARFNVLQDMEDDNVYYFYEVYKDEAAVAAHRAAPHTPSGKPLLTPWTARRSALKPAPSFRPTQNIGSLNS